MSCHMDDSSKIVYPCLAVPSHDMLRTLSLYMTFTRCLPLHEGRNRCQLPKQWQIISSHLAGSTKKLLAGSYFFSLQRALRKQTAWVQRRLRVFAGRGRWGRKEGREYRGNNEGNRLSPYAKYGRRVFLLTRFLCSRRIGSERGT